MVIVLKNRNAERTIKNILQAQPASTALQKVVDFLYENFENYNWVGIYLVKGDNLVLGPWNGAQATEHTTIPLGRGVCGAAAKTGKTELVDDVSKDSRYLSCFLSTRSEIVVPIRKGPKVVGEIDIDSDAPAAFDRTDVVFLEKVADMLSRHI
jgi:L-methionine (R)-S-oxide reductase